MLVLNWATVFALDPSNTVIKRFSCSSQNKGFDKEIRINKIRTFYLKSFVCVCMCMCVSNIGEI